MSAENRLPSAANRMHPSIETEHTHFIMLFAGQLHFHFAPEQRRTERERWELPLSAAGEIIKITRLETRLFAAAGAMWVGATSSIICASLGHSARINRRAARASRSMPRRSSLPFMLLFLFMSSMESRLPGRQVAASVALLALNAPNFLFCLNYFWHPLSTRSYSSV